LHEQFNYALDNVESIRRASGNSAGLENGSESIRSAIL
jgi:ATP-dependent metalloprotease